MPMLSPVLRKQLAFFLLSMLAMLGLFSLLRLALLVYNYDQAGDTPLLVILEGFFNGARFDLRVASVACLPVLLALLSVRLLKARAVQVWWLIMFASVALFLGVMELDFYRSFHQRLNSLVFQYMKEDPQTVLSMLWYGFPVVRYLLVWAAGSILLIVIFKYISARTKPVFSAEAVVKEQGAPARTIRFVTFLVLFLMIALAARGTLRQGPPLRWGDAFTTDYMFINQLGINGTLSLYEAARTMVSSQQSNAWKASLPEDEALAQVRSMLLTPDDTLVDGETAAVRRTYSPPMDKVLPIRNVVVILMESLSGQFVGALGGEGNITPNFDQLSKEGLLFTNFFSNGTHTHQGMFATMACFPNLPGFEYLMQIPQGQHQFSGLPQLLKNRGYDNLYVYNGDFAWDNQSGFFGNQGMSRFIGRNDYTNPVFSDPTWGVSDQDMFDRGAEELAGSNITPPFYALLQTLSNHTPYALPPVLPVEKVTGHGALDDHLTAMRYSDWALGRFFEQAKKSPYYKETLFVVVGDHGFGSNTQLTEIDLNRFRVPLLLIAPGIQERFGPISKVVGTQVDIVPTIMGRLGSRVTHQCWGRDLLNLQNDDQGIGVIKPSGNDQTVAIINGDKVLVKAKGLEPRLYQYQAGERGYVERIYDADKEKNLMAKLGSYLQVATGSLINDTAGATTEKR